MVAPSILLALFFASGLAGLMYELLWVRALALVYGNTAHATATTLAVVFLGMSIGQYAAGRRAVRSGNPLRSYALLEGAVAATATAYFAVVPLARALLPPLVARLGSGFAATAVRAALGAGALLPLWLCIGATLPVMGQALIRRPGDLGPTFGLLYAVQTGGGALGAFAAGFWLPPLIGFTATYLVAIAISVTVAALAYAASGAANTRSRPTATAHQLAPRRRTAGIVGTATSVACLSGFAALAIEVLWTTMFAQALHNSVYSFAMILMTFLASIGIGGVLARVLVRGWRARPLDPLVMLLALSGVAVAASPFIFNWMTAGLRLYASAGGWSGHVRATFGAAAAVMLAPGILLGTVFPYTMGIAGDGERGAGAVIGELASWNTMGGVAGSLIAGFVLLPWLGLWGSLRATAFLYLAAAIAVAARATGRSTRALMLAPAVGAVLLLTVLDPTGLVHVSLRPGEALLAVRESADGTVAVTETDGILELRLNGHYVVGGSGAITNDRRQAELPMLLYPQPRSVLFLGLGTGITAGAALFHPVERVTVAELVPDIRAAAEEFFAQAANGLFTDARAHLVAEDARVVLLDDTQRYDVIVGDLFVPWDAGTGSLYTREHFAAVRDRLTTDGVFAQWLPLYQLSWREFAVIAHTMLDVFPLVTVWRGDFSATEPVIGLIGYNTPRPLDLDTVVANVRRRQNGAGYSAQRAHALALLFYAGNLSAARGLVDSAPINTDDRPVIEYLAPVTPMEVVAGRSEWLTGLALSRFWAQLAAMVPLDADPYLVDVPPEERDYVYAGRMLDDAAILRAADQDAEARRAFDEFAARVPPEVASAFAGLRAPD